MNPAPLMVRVPPEGAAALTIEDRSSGTAWDVEVAPFDCAVTAVTREQWCAVMGGEPAAPTDCPQAEVSWFDAIAYCNALSARLGLNPVYRIEAVDAPGFDRRSTPHHRPAPVDWAVEWDRTADGFRLPTEAEWQCACRAGTTGPHYGRLEEIAWFAGTSGDRPHPVARLSPNPWGLYDVLGGVWEWCWDLYDPEVYGPYRVIRGGGFADPPWSCRAGVRRKTQPSARLEDLGLRVVRTAAPTPTH